jgi:hypothetical protein
MRSVTVCAGPSRVDLVGRASGQRSPTTPAYAVRAESAVARSRASLSNASRVTGSGCGMSGGGASPHHTATYLAASSWCALLARSYDG